MSKRIPVGNALDMTGHRYGRLEVLYRVEPVGIMACKRVWRHVRCYCGVEFDTAANNLRRGRTKSCGCYRQEVLEAHNFKQKARWGKYGS